MELTTTHRFISNLSSMLDTLSEFGLVHLFTKRVLECQGVCPLRLALAEGNPLLFLCLYSVQDPCPNMWLDTTLITVCVFSGVKRQFLIYGISTMEVDKTCSRGESEIITKLR